MNGTQCVWMVFDVSSCNWGAGYLDKNKQFQREKKRFLFLHRPKHFIIYHFPWQSLDEGEDSKAWQLLSKSISLDSINKTLKLERNAIMWNVIPLTHKEGIVEAHEEVDIVIGDERKLLCDTMTEFTNMETGMSLKVLLVCVRKNLGNNQFPFDRLQMDYMNYTFLAKIWSQRNRILCWWHMLLSFQMFAGNIVLIRRTKVKCGECTLKLLRMVYKDRKE